VFTLPGVRKFYD
jgi:uncharacterized damage-inducible protein DinB